MPYVPAISPLSNYLVSKDYGVIQPQYYGSFDSEGYLTPKRAVSTIFEIEKQLKKRPWRNYRNDKDFVPPPTVDLAAAHSYGTNLLYSALLMGFRPRLMILQSPFFLFGANGMQAGQRADFTTHVQQMANALPLTFRFDRERTWMNFFVRSPQIHPPTRKVPSSRQRTKLICVVGSNDGDIDAGASRAYIEQAANTYKQAFELIAYIVVPGAGHDQATLMSAEFMRIVEPHLM